MMNILNGQYNSDKCVIEAVGKEFTCHNCGVVYEIGDYLSIIPNAYMVSSRSEVSKSKANMEIEAWLNEPHVKDGRENYDGDAIMKDLEMLNKAAGVTNKFLENMLAKINKPVESFPVEIETPEDNEPAIEEVPEASNEAQAVLQACTVEGNIVKLPPDQLDRKVYAEVKKALELIGGKWKGGKTYGFVFKTDPTELLAQIANGEKRNLKKEYQFYATPAALAENMVSIAELYTDNGGAFAGDILEPSAGQGAIVKAIHAVTGDAVTIYCYELMDINRGILEKMPGVKLIGDDFLKAASVEQYDRIIANPPFTKNQDIDHILLMYNLLKPGGIMVTLSSPSWTFGSQKKHIEFRQWLVDVDAYIEEIPEDTFKESGTSIRTVLIKIRKPLTEKIEQ
jgi:hypothetical protein